MSYLPYQDTKVSANQSMAKIIQSLEDVGFTKIAQYTDEGRKYIVAMHKEANFTFEANIDEIKVMIQRQRKTPIKDIQKKAEKIAWRILYHRVKSTVDSVKYRVEELAEVFGGHLSFSQGGKQVYLANVITAQIASGEMKSGGFPGMPQLSAPESSHE